MRFKTTIGLLVLLLVSSQSYASIMYTVDRMVGAATVKGTITTNGTIGVLDDDDILDFSLVLDDGIYNVPISDANGGTHFAFSFPADPGGSPMTATATQLLFDFTSSGVVHFQLDPTDTGTPFWCLAGSLGHCVGAFNAESIKTSKTPAVSYSAANAGSAVVVANVVSEPGTLAMLILGITGFVASRRRKA